MKRLIIGLIVIKLLTFVLSHEGVSVAGERDLGSRIERLDISEDHKLDLELVLLEALEIEQTGALSKGDERYLQSVVNAVNGIGGADPLAGPPHNDHWAKLTVVRLETLVERYI